MSLTCALLGCDGVVWKVKALEARLALLSSEVGTWEGAHSTLACQDLSVLSEADLQRLERAQSEQLRKTQIAKVDCIAVFFCFIVDVACDSASVSCGSAIPAVAGGFTPVSLAAGST